MDTNLWKLFQQSTVKRSYLYMFIICATDVLEQMVTKKAQTPTKKGFQFSLIYTSVKTSNAVMKAFHLLQILVILISEGKVILIFCIYRMYDKVGNSAELTIPRLSIWFSLREFFHFFFLSQFSYYVSIFGFCMNFLSRILILFFFFQIFVSFRFFQYNVSEQLDCCPYRIKYWNSTDGFVIQKSKLRVSIPFTMRTEVTISIPMFLLLN